MTILRFSSNGLLVPGLAKTKLDRSHTGNDPLPSRGSWSPSQNSTGGNLFASEAVMSSCPGRLWTSEPEVLALWPCEEQVLPLT